METYTLWDNHHAHNAKIEWYEPKTKKSNAAVVIFPGGAYKMLADHEGKGYAEYLNSIGITAFVVYYTLAPEHFPLQLLDARRAVRFVRANSEKFGVDKDKICVMGSSAGGHLTALVSTYTKGIAGEDVDEIDQEAYLPNGQILCYPVIVSDRAIGHTGSYTNLLGEDVQNWEDYDPSLILDENTPKAFIWHTASDGSARVLNSYRYATALYGKGIPCEVHVFPWGPHGSGLAEKIPHVAQWANLLKNWFEYYEFL